MYIYVCVYVCMYAEMKIEVALAKAGLAQQQQLIK